MSQALPPLLLRPHYVPKPWGGRRLADELGRQDLPEGPIGESWEVADTDTVASVIDGGPYDGRRLRDVWGAPFPLLLKVLDAREDLSVQLHPDGREGRPVKEEAWIGLAAGGRVAVGSVAGQALPDAGAWLDALETLPLEGGAPRADAPPAVVHVPPGTVHAILGGTLVFEVQNPVDLTWRVDDHGRVGLDGQPRDLHLDEAGPLLQSGPVAAPAPLQAGRDLRAERFAIALLPPGTHALGANAAGRVGFFRRGGEVSAESGTLAVPRARTVVLPACRTHLTSADWIVVATATTAAEA